MNPENVRQVTDPEVHREPSTDVTGYPDDQDIETAQVESGLDIADEEAREEAELERPIEDRRAELD